MLERRRRTGGINGKNYSKPKRPTHVIERYRGEQGQLAGLQIEMEQTPSTWPKYQGQSKLR